MTLQVIRRFPMRVMLAAIFAAACCAGLLAPGAVVAHSGEEHVEGLDGRLPHQPDLSKVGNTTYRYLPGREEYEISAPNRPSSFIHVDYKPSALAEVGGPAIALPGSELEPVCRTSGNRIVVIYSHRASDSTPTPTAALRSVVKRMNWKISDQSAQSSAGARAIRMAVDCNAEGQINVYNITTASNGFPTISAAAKAQVYGTPVFENAVKYLVFDHAESEENLAAGIGEIFDDATKNHYNDNSSRTDVALVYGSSWERHVSIHELFHTLGASQGVIAPSAPFSTPGHHCNDGFDVLCYDDGTGFYFETACPEASGYLTPTTVPIDCGKDTYFNAAPDPKVWPQQTWLAENWDVAGSEDGFLVAPPKAVTEAATTVKGKSAVAHAQINPEGTKTSYFVEYGLKSSGSYTKKTASTNINYGGEFPYQDATKAVSPVISGLELGTTYKFRAVAKNVDGSYGYGGEQSFTTLTPPKPTAATEAATSVKAAEATMNATINPNGETTIYQFEYGKSNSYGQLAPPAASWNPFLEEKQLEGTVGIKVSEKASFKVEPNTTYHFRVRAENEGGATYGADQTFTTPRAVSTPTFSSAFGSTGTGNGQFKEAGGVAIDSAGNAWVVDTANNRVEKFNSKGEYQSQFGSFGTGNGQFNRPFGIAIDASGNIWVTDGLNNRVQEFNSKGEYLFKFGSTGTGNGQLKGPRGIAFDSKGNIWIAEKNNNRVQKLNSKGEFLLKIGGPEGGGSGNGEFAEPWGITVDFADDVWVLDTNNRRVQEFNTEGKYLSKFGKLGSGDGEFFGPLGIASDARGTLWITDSGNNRVQEFYPEGEYVTQFGTKGAGENQFSGSMGIAPDPEGNIWVTDMGNNRVSKWKQSVPAADTRAATAITRTTATLNATVNPQGTATSYQFEYGPTTSYGKVAPLSPKSIGSGSAAVKVSEPLNLKSGTTYYYHVIATTAAGSTYGETRHFTTLPPPDVGAAWRIGGKTFTELGVKEETFSVSGTAKIAIPTLATTFNCTESGSGTLSSTGSVLESVTLSCVLVGLEKYCTVEPIKLTLDGPFHGYGSSTLMQIVTKGEGCNWFSSVTLANDPLPGTFDYGTEAVALNVNAYGSSKFGAHVVELSNISTWQWNAANKGKTAGIW